MAYLDQDKTPRLPEEQCLYNEQLQEVRRRIEHIQSELSGCAHSHEALMNDESFMQMIARCQKELSGCIRRCAEHMIF